jgi:amino acid transporter
MVKNSVRRGHGFGTAPVFLAAISANLGVAVLWVVVITLGISLLLFFMGKPPTDSPTLDIFARVKDPNNFFIVFAIIFPAFTGMTAGVGLSGDLKNPRKSIPLGTLAATITGMIVYFLVVLKLSYSLSPQDLAADQLAMSKIALWGPIIPIGLAAATLSSAIGSILIAPRTLQALAGDHTFPARFINKFLEKGKGESNEPVNATLITSIIVLVFVSPGSVDFVAQIISMFFMITYGSLCLVSFLEHFAGNPSYRPTFRSRWYLSLIGAIACFIMMFQMAPVYALLSLLAISGIYLSLRRGREEPDDLSAMIKGVLFQLTRLNRLIDQGRIPISRKNVRKIPWNKDKTSYEALVTEHSEEADLVIMGFSLKKLIKEKWSFFSRFESIEDILFVQAGQKIVITAETE